MTCSILPMTRSAFLTNHTPQVQQDILDFYLQKADQFRAYFPGGEDLSGSRPDFLALEGVIVQPWSGMAGCMVATGTLTPAAKALIRERGNLDEDGSYHPLRLWSYELVSEAEVLVRVEDFSVWIIFATPDERQILEKQKISVGEWQDISFAPKEDVTPLSINADDLGKITSGIQEAFSPKQE